MTVKMTTSQLNIQGIPPETGLSCVIHAHAHVLRMLEFSILIEECKES